MFLFAIVVISVHGLTRNGMICVIIIFIKILFWVILESNFFKLSLTVPHLNSAVPLAPTSI